MSVLMSAADVSPIPMKIQETMVSQAGTAMSLILSPSSERPLFSERLWCFLPARFTLPRWVGQPQRSACAGAVPGRLSLAVLSLLSEVAGQQPSAAGDAGSAGQWQLAGRQFNSEIGHLPVRDWLL